MLSLEQGTKLVNLAKISIASYFTGEAPNLDEYKKEFSEEQGVFVTLTINKELRGCIGFPESPFPLYKGVFNAAKAAAFEDPRFPSLSEEEWPSVAVEISILTVPKKIDVNTPEDYLNEIKVGRDGLIVRNNSTSGLLLPQVPLEYEWTELEFLQHTCVKAGLEMNAWKDLDNKVYKFQAQVFTEVNNTVEEKI
ncbi:TIGR00296 family protein [Candidatus Woesearchaeota archaeon]|jgi:uncharacterized protein|nr:TIGR00296 family protein [Candidatus Woesearchaeota archaeon]MBT3538301.1 TIGR00296 family protein [Candidatus Woesearchaeota archaeon]MBT4696705.1 TIGR00296 family protein [Candidatus Woesearchaeota archaeon]MBT4716823.1 TIGR00296 family protein [Candidatus Woesearchaeota archaeon]MBT7105970.1 TIGR00296 family protein [Candidatus Woesearchaeota archaeon]